MRQRKCAVFSARGLGDGLVSLMLSQQLHLNGFSVITYHPNQLQDLQDWYPHLPIVPTSLFHDFEHLLNENEKIFLFFDGNSETMLRIIHEGKTRCPEKIYVLNPSPSKKEKEPSSYDDLGFDPSLTMVENLERFCRLRLGLEKSSKCSGIVLPPNLSFRQEKRKVILHPTSGRKGRSWPAEKFVKLALHLKKEEFFPVFVIQEKEVDTSPGLLHQGIDVYLFSNLQQLVSYVATAGYMIGNDSGIGHLAAALGLPTVTICRHYRIAKIWRPGWGLNEVVYPFRWIPNIHGFRFRDLYWKKFISVKRVKRAFEAILKQEKSQ